MTAQPTNNPAGWILGPDPISRMFCAVNMWLVVPFISLLCSNALYHHSNHVFSCFFSLFLCVRCWKR